MPYYISANAPAKGVLKCGIEAAFDQLLTTTAGISKYQKELCQLLVFQRGAQEVRLLSKSQQVLARLPAFSLGVSNSATVKLPFINMLCPLILQVRKLLRA